MSKLKHTIEENGGFQHWFVNVFWYHYRWPMLIAVVVLGIVAFITFDSMRQVRYDTTVVIATDYFVDDEKLEALDDVLRPVVEDRDGNGVVKINYAVLYLGDTEVGRQNEERMYLYMTQDDVSMYLMSENVSDAFTNPILEYFTDPVDTYGLPADENNPVRVNLDGNPVLAECGMEHIYLSIMDYASAKYSLDSGIAMANALLESGKTDDNP